jgi:Rrf2 family protein
MLFRGQDTSVGRPPWRRKNPISKDHFRLDNVITFVTFKLMHNCRFAFAVHVMAVLGLEKDHCYPSSRLAETVNTNPVVIRRILIELQDAGLISTSRGPRGGSVLMRKPDKVTLREIRSAVEKGPVFGSHPNKPSRKCPVGKNINRVMTGIADRAGKALERELEKITLADVLLEIGGHGEGSQEHGDDFTTETQRTRS